MEAKRFRVPWRKCSGTFNHLILASAFVLLLAFDGCCEAAVCKEAVQTIFEDVVPSGKLGREGKTMAYTRLYEVKTFKECYEACCEDQNCNVAFMYMNQSRSTCFKVGIERGEIGKL